MNRRTQLFLALAALVVAVPGNADADHHAGDAAHADHHADHADHAAHAAHAAEDAVTLEGSFVWARNDGDRTGPLTAVMTPDGDSEWDVAFHFTWEDEPHTYLGRASGTLGNGMLEGTATSDNPDHLLEFEFSGEFEDGTFYGTHGFVQEDGSLKDGGSLTLALPE